MVFIEFKVINYSRLGNISCGEKSVWFMQDGCKIMVSIRFKRTVERSSSRRKRFNSMEVECFNKIQYNPFRPLNTSRNAY